MVFRPSDPTTELDIVNNKIVTAIDYNIKYGVEVYVNENVMPVNKTYSENGKQAFITNYTLAVGDLVRWTIYAEQVQQRVALSKVLRPIADL